MSPAQSSSPFTLPFPILIADIGGTNARFAIVVDSYAEPRVFASIKTADYETLEDAIQTHVLDHTSLLPRVAILAVAGPVGTEEIDLTNAHWVIRPRPMMEQLGLEEVIVLNDYAAQALAVVALEDIHLEAIGKGKRDPLANRVIIGPGTGLGMAGLVHAQQKWIPVAGEGGHTDLGPKTARDHEIFPHLEHIGGRISGEQILSGRGIVNLYQAIAKADGRQATLDKPSDVTAAARNRSDPLAVETIDLFTEYLGRVAGDMALVFMARGGVYLTGGITKKIMPFLDKKRFRAGFDDKAPHEDLMRSIPVDAIMHDRAPMEGLTAYARTPSRFGVSLDRRHWKR